MHYCVSFNTGKMATSGTGFNTSCTNTPDGELEARNLSRSVSAMICAFITMTVLVALFLSKAYKTTLQRLFLYLTITVLIQLICISMNIVLQFEFEIREDLCKYIAFFTVWTAVSTYLIATLITLYLLYIVYTTIRAQNEKTHWVESKKIIDLIALVVCVILPVSFLWIPMYHGTYGSDSISCWIIHTRQKDCEFLGFHDIVCFSFGIFYLTSCIIIVAFAGVALVFCTFAIRYRTTRHRLLKSICQTLLLMTFITLSALVEVFGLIQYVHNTVSQNKIPFKILVLYDGAIPFSQMIIFFGFIFYNFKFSCKKAHTCYKRIHEKLRGKNSPTMEVELLSSTSNVTSNNLYVIQPLIRDKQKNYGSIRNRPVKQ